MLNMKNMVSGSLLGVLLWSAAGLPDADARRRAYSQPHFAGAPTGALRRTGSGGGSVAGVVLFWIGFLALLGVGKVFMDDSPEPRRDPECDWSESLDSKRREVERLVVPDVLPPELVDLILMCSNLDVGAIRRVASFDPGLRRLVAAFDEQRRGMKRSYRDVMASPRASFAFVAVFQAQADRAARGRISPQGHDS